MGPRTGPADLRITPSPTPAGHPPCPPLLYKLYFCTSQLYRPAPRSTPRLARPAKCQCALRVCLIAIHDAR
ncbi:hypothetical protein C8R44DRAFT_781972 [Mycena epipterygia]|nr:hypothetical protein C8R44DRAFT_781972 [Mycena epipterygia]